MNIHHETVRQLRLVLQDCWVLESDLFAVPHWDKETLKMALKLGVVLGVFKCRKDDKGEVSYTL